MFIESIYLQLNDFKKLNAKAVEKLKGLESIQLETGLTDVKLRRQYEAEGILARFLKPVITQLCDKNIVFS